MKVVILAGGLGTRISEESHLRPKPMIEIGGQPIIWHIMKIYSYYGFNEFILCCGYKGYVIKEYFNNYYLHTSNITFDFTNGNKLTVHNNMAEPWRVTLVDTGMNTMTGGRIKRIENYLDDDETFLLTYGDGVSDVPIDRLVAFHENHGKLATLTAVQPSGKYGVLDIDNSSAVSRFIEKPQGDESWVNGGFFVLNKEIFKYIDNDSVVLEREPLEKLTEQGELCAYKHSGFWQPLDTMRDKELLEKYWNGNRAPWKIWT